MHLAQYVERITVGADKVSIGVRPSILNELAAKEVNEDLRETIPAIDVPVQLKRYGLAARLIVKSPASETPHAPDATLVALLAKAHDWFGRLSSGRSSSLASIAAEEEVGSTYVSRIIHLAFLAPDIVQRIAKGEHPSELTAKKLRRLLPLPEDWAEQRALLGFH